MVSQDHSTQRASHGTRKLISTLAGVLLPLALIACSSCARQEKSPSEDRRQPEFAATITADAKTIRCDGGETVRLTLEIQNQGSNAWSSDAPFPCLVSYHLLDEKSRLLRFENPRTRLPGTVEPGEKVSVTVPLRAPLEKGSYLVEFDLLREGIAWFKDGGGKTLVLPFLVEEKRWPEDAFSPSLGYGAITSFESSIPELDKLRRLIRLTLEKNEVAFEGKTGRIVGFAAGSAYPQIWLRDAATILPASRFYYPEPYLATWLEEHLAHQKETGSLEDWVNSLGQTDKNTVETDQEASAVLAAYQVFLLLGQKGKGWLAQDIAGVAMLERLEKALAYIFRERYDEKYGLVTGAHTADWGDVDPEDGDQKAIYVDERTRWTADIYDQAMAYEACSALASMFAAVGESERAAMWQQRASLLKERANSWLWQEGRGFYRVHVHLDDFPHDFDEEGMFPMGGNAQAIISGLADSTQARRIIETALVRQSAFGLSTLSGVLLPPYPKGFFKHPALDEPYEYQNGGQWDWFGGRLILGMFQNGFSRRAKAKLVEIINKNIENGGLYEWDTREGRGRGSDDYAGSAGSLARAVFEGYFGFHLGPDGLVLEPRLGEDTARVHFYLPAADLYAAYDYQPDPDKRRIVFRYRSNVPAAGRVRLVFPWSLLGFEDRERGRKQVRVLMDGKEIPFERWSLNEDDYLGFPTDFTEHHIVIERIPG